MEPGLVCHVGLRRANPTYKNLRPLSQCCSRIILSPTDCLRLLRRQQPAQFIQTFRLADFFAGDQQGKVLGEDFLWMNYISGVSADLLQEIFHLAEFKNSRCAILFHRTQAAVRRELFDHQQPQCPEMVEIISNLRVEHG